MECGPEDTTMREVPKTGRFPKTSGCTTTSGQDYEVALCCLVFLRALRLTSDFYLASNHASAGKFDDVVLFYRMKEDHDPRYRAIMLQAKHKENTKEKKLTSSYPFILKEYLDSIKKIENLWEQPVNVQNQLIEFLDISLVLYSNAMCAIGDTALDVTTSPQVSHLSGFLNTGGRILRISDAQRAGLPAEPKTSDFIQRLFLCTEQTSVKTADQILQEEISNVLRLTSLDVANELTSKLKYMVKKWWEEEGEGCYLTRQSEEWRKILEMQVTRLNADTLIIQSQLNLDFSRSAIEEVKSIIGRTQIWVSVRDKYHALATRLRLLKALRSCLVLDTKLVDSQFDEVVAVWGTVVCPTLVFDVSADSPENLSQLLQRLLMAVSNHASRKLVVISKEKPKTEQWFVLQAEATWSVLDLQTQERLLDVNVDLQDKFVALRDVVGLEKSFIMSDEIIHSIWDPVKGVGIGVPSFKLGAPIPTQLEYYVPRCVQRISSKIITYDTLNKTGTIIFPKTLLPSKPIQLREIKILFLSDLRREIRVDGTVLILGEFSDFVIQDLCCRFCVRGISGDIGEEGLENTIVEYIPFTYICEEKVVVVEGVPGVGKSSFVTAMCSRVKERFPGSWVIRVDMGKHSEFIRETNFTDSSDIRTFLLKGLQKDLHSLGQDLLDHSLYVTGNVFLFLDAFDEMNPNFTDKCCDLLKKIVTTFKFKQLVVTTRPITSKQVEEALGTEAFHLPVFSWDEQRLFLERFCKNKEKNVNEREISDLHHSAGAVLEIPLHCKLAAEVLLLSDDYLLLKFLNPWKKVLLYQLFVKHSINNRLAEKYIQDIVNPGAHSLLELAENDHLQNLQALAVRKLLPFNHLSSFEISTKLPDEKFGLVVYNGESVEFEHQNFAEYFLGCWLSRHWKICPKKLLLEIFFHFSFQFVVQTMSWLLFEDFPLHKAVAQGDVDAVRQHLSPGTTDEGGRSALHVAAMTEGKQDEVVDLLMSNGEATNKKDDVFDSDAVRFAENFGNWEFVDAVLRNGKKLEGLNFITDQNSAFQVLIQITKRDFTTLFQYIIGVHKEMIRYITDLKRNTLLHVAAASNSTSVLKLLTELQHEVNFPNNDGNTPLHLTSIFGCKEAAMVLLEVGADLNIKNAYGFTALFLAADQGHLEIVKLLLEKAADANIIIEDDNSTLMQAVFRGRLDVVKLLIEKGANPNFKIKYGVTPMMIAADQGHVELVNLLIEIGVDPNVKDYYGKTALMQAALRGQLEIVKLLIEKGANPNMKCNNYPQMLMFEVGSGYFGIRHQPIEDGANQKLNDKYEVTTLMLATVPGHLEVVKLLLEKGVDPNIKIEDGKTVLMVAADKGYLEIVKVLIEKGADATVKAEDGKTALMLAASQGHLEVMKLLIEKGADPNIKDIYSITPMMMAAGQGHLEVVNLLIEIGVDPNIKDDYGKTALMLAAVRGQLEIVRLLLEKGADPTVKAEDGKTVLMLTASQGHLEVVKLLIEKGADPKIKDKVGATALMWATYSGYFEIVKLLLEKGIDPNIKTYNGKTALMMAADQGHLEVVKLLLGRGANTSIKEEDGLTALMVAALRGQLEIVKLLLQKRVNPNNTAKNGDTALMMAAHEGHLEVVKLLIEKGANPKIKKQFGVTSLMIATFSSHLQVMNLLIEKGVDPNLKTKDGTTALMVAAERGHLEAVKLLIDNGADPSIMADDGRTALRRAGHHGHREVVKLLIEKVKDIGYKV